MINKEVAELRRRYRPDRNPVTKLLGCYVNVHGELVSTFSESMALLPVEEQEKYLALLKKSLSGTVGKALVDISFTTAQVVDSPEHRLLMQLRDSSLSDADAAEALFQKIAGSLHLGVNYLILLAADTYDVPYRAKDDAMLPDSSETQYSYILCSICPVKETKPELYYDAKEHTFHNRGTQWVVKSPELGFLFPAFDDRATNLYGALYYTRDASASYDEFVDAVFHTKPPMPAGVQTDTFREILSDSLEEECSMEVVQNVHTRLRDMVQVHKEAKTPEPLCVSRQDVGQLLEDCGISERKMASFNVKYDCAFGVDSQISPENLVNARQLEYRTPDVVIKVNPDRQELVETRTIGGVNYILIRAEDGVEFNGIAVHLDTE